MLKKLTFHESTQPFQL